jgi:hypothetical protein
MFGQTYGNKVVYQTICRCHHQSLEENMATPAAAQNFVKISKVIRLQLQGCVNRPFYHIVVQNVNISLIFNYTLFQTYIFIASNKLPTLSATCLSAIKMISFLYFLHFSLLFRNEILRMVQFLNKSAAMTHYQMKAMRNWLL